ncbi:MAG: 50S ribosomal protein L21 [Hyphomicrobiales bacterium]|nr:50S ribosomal protein L21 [Hyphomicrobiales bacterium]
MYAVIKTGGKQYRVAAEDTLIVEKLAGEPGDVIEFGEVLMHGADGEPTIGTPFVSGAMVSAEVVEQGRADKIIIFKKKRRQNYRRRNGHRQDITTVRILEILIDGKKAKQSATPKAKAETAMAETPKAKPKKAPASDQAVDASAEPKPKAGKKPAKQSDE